MEQDTNYIGQVIRKYRHEKKLSQDDLARLSGVSYNAIVKLERKNVVPNPTVMTLQKIAGVLGMTNFTFLFKHDNVSE
jgi:transcriptional regulator with XRE-family HTH domain